MKENNNFINIILFFILYLKAKVILIRDIRKKIIKILY